jgi:hypothetical protein
MMGGAQSFSGRDGKGESVCLCQELNNGCPASVLVNVLSYFVICRLRGGDMAVYCSAPVTAPVIKKEAPEFDVFNFSKVLRFFKTATDFKYCWKIFVVLRTKFFFSFLTL